MVSISELDELLKEFRGNFSEFDRKLKVLYNEIQDDNLESEMVADILLGREDEDNIEENREFYYEMILKLEDVINCLSNGRQLDSMQYRFLQSVGMAEE